MPQTFSKKGYALVLSGGAIRGFAHLGVLRAISEKNIPIRMIEGSSAGAIAGFLYASGNYDNAYDKIIDYRLRDLMHLIDLESPFRGIVRGNKIVKRIIELTGKRKLEELLVPMTVSTTDFHTGKNILYSKGDIAKVLKASFSVPGIFPVVSHEGYSLMDGDISNSLPIESIKGSKIICVDVKSSPLSFAKTNSYEAIMKSVEIMGGRLLKDKLEYARKKKAIIIQPRLENIDFVSFSQMKKAVNIGYEDAMKALGEAGL